MSITLNNKDEIIMRLVHYFVTVENYQPIIVNGVKNEIWLENLSAPYRIIRINSNYIHNYDQFEFDSFKIKNVTRQIKKKTLTLKMRTLNILLDLNGEVKIDEDRAIDTFKIDSIKDVRKDTGLAGIFPKLKTFTLQKGDNLDLIVKITNDINNKTDEDNKTYEKIFKPKKILITKALIIINVILFVLQVLSEHEVTNIFFLSPDAVRNGEYYRLITAAFVHANILHLFVNMYALNILGNQVETFLGKWKFILIYLVSAVSGSLMSMIVSNVGSLGASGAIFGLLGALAYFGYHYRLYLGDVLKSQILPVIMINLFIGFMIEGIDNAAHIGGLFGGAFLAMALGLGHKDEQVSRINGIAVTLIYIGFLVYMMIR